eukprot:5718390-Karenia_brevis.AAC.1
MPSCGTYYWNKDVEPVRIDYVLLSSQWQVMPNTAKTYQIELGAKSLDHLATGLSASCPVKASSSARRRRRVSYNRALVRNLECQQHFAQLVNNSPVISADVEPTTHVHILENWLRNAASTAFPLDKRQPSKAWISQHSFELIGIKKRLLKSFSWLGWAAKQASVRAVFYTWRGVPGRAKWDHVRGFVSKKICNGRVWASAAIQS